MKRKVWRGLVVATGLVAAGSLALVLFATPSSVRGSAVQVQPQAASASHAAATRRQGYLGVGLLAVTGAAAQKHGVPYGEGAVVEAVVPGGPADIAGVRAGDVIVDYDGQAVRDYAALAAILRATNPGTQVRLRILRQGHAMNIKARLGSSPSISGVNSSSGGKSGSGAPEWPDDFFKKFFGEPSGSSSASGGTGAPVPSEDPLRRGCGADLQATRQAAERGDAFSQDVLGHCYNAGMGVPHDVAQAFAWFGKAAEQGNADAQLFVGNYYAFGVGRPASATEGDKWFAKAAAQDNPAAEYNLATAYAHGWGVGQDEVQAFYWYGKAAAHRSGRAEYHVGLAYESGAGVGKSARKALEWYRKAVRDSHDLQIRDLAKKGIERVSPLASGQASPYD